MIRYLGQTGVAAALLLFALAAFGESPEMVATDYFGEGEEPTRHPMVLQRAAIDVDILPGYAATTVELEFFNPTDVDVEGDLTLELPRGSIVTGYGLDIDGSIRRGVIVEQSVATEIIDESVRRGIDPGLGETTRDNAFHTRVFPVNGKSTRSIRVSFVSPVSESQPYILPLATENRLASLHVEIRSRGPRPKVHLPEGVRLRWEKGDVVQGRGSTSNVALTRALRIEPGKQAYFAIERWNDEELFLAAAVPVASAQNPGKPETLRVLWDTSLSHAESAAQELQFLADLLKHWPDVGLELVLFDSAAEAIATVVDPRAALEEVVYHGGTSLEALFAAQGHSDASDRCILFSDGRKTIGDFPGEQLPCRLDAVTAAPDADRLVLAELARSHGGSLIDLNEVTTDAALSNLEAPVEDVSLHLDGKDEIGATIWSNDGKWLRLVSPITNETTSGRLRFGEHILEMDLTELTPLDGSTYAPVWASAMIARERGRGAPQADLFAISRKYEVETRETAFIVLETLREYVLNEIELPATGFSREQLTEYAILKAEFADDQDRFDKQYEEYLEEAWRRLGVWHGAEFDSAAGQKLTENDVLAERPVEPDLAWSDMDGWGSAASGGDEFLEEIIVTAMKSSAPVGPTRSHEHLVQLTSWTPDREYLAPMKGLCGDQFWLEYHRQRQRFGDIPAFYFEMFDHATNCNEPHAESIALSTLELPISDAGTMTAVAMRLARHGEHDLAIDVFRQAAHARPQSSAMWRNLGVALAQLATNQVVDDHRATEMLSEALNLLIRVGRVSPGETEDGIELAALIEANHVLEALRARGADSAQFDSGLNPNLDLDLRVVLSWNTFGDLDLWVVEPSGEKVSYNNKLSKAGGLMPKDIVGSFGPEQYLVKTARPGKYELYVDYYEADQLKPNGAVVVRLDVFRNWGRIDESQQTTWLELTSDEESEYLAGTITVQ